MLLSMPFFFFGITISTFIFSGILRERSRNTWRIYLVDGWSMLISGVGISQWMWCVCDLDQENMKSISLGSQKFGKPQ
jgi:hypothetical protein